MFLKVSFPLRIGVDCFQKIWSTVMVKQRRFVSFFMGIGLQQNGCGPSSSYKLQYQIRSHDFAQAIHVLPCKYIPVIVDWNFWIIVHSTCSRNEKAWFACITVRKLVLKNFSKQNRLRGLLFFWKCIMGPAWLKNGNYEKQGSRKERTGSAFLSWIRIFGIGSLKARCVR